MLISPRSVISYYLPTLLRNIGVKDVNTQLLLNIIYALVGWVAATAGTRCHDIIGRRKMFMGSTTGMIISLALTSATAAVFVNTGSTAASTASIFFIYLFGAVFAFGFTSMQPIYPAEVMSNDMRAKGMGTFKLTAGTAGFVNTFAAPLALSSVSSIFLRKLIYSSPIAAFPMGIYRPKSLTSSSLIDRLLVLRILCLLGLLRTRIHLLVLRGDQRPYFRAIGCCFRV